MNAGLRREGFRGAVAIAVGAFLGTPLGHPALGALIAAILVLVRHLRSLGHLADWISGTHRGAPPEGGGGLWEEVCDALYAFQTHHRGRQRLLLTIANRFRNSIRAMPDAMVLLDARDDIVWCNESATRLLGLRLTDTGRNVGALVRSPAFLEFLARGDFSQPIEITSPHDERLLLTVQIAPYGEGDRLLLARDVTRLRELERARRDFAANASHELRTPLTVVHGYVELLRDAAQVTPAERDRMLGHIEQQSLRMRRIVDDLLMISRLEHESRAESDAVVDIPAMAEALAQEARQISGLLGHVVEVGADHGLLLLGAREELWSAFSNLVSNAVRHTPAGGRIGIRWFAEGEGACLEVSDTGEGIPRRHIPRLTERFYRVDVSRSRASGGTGLGLAIVKHVLVRHGAELEIDSSPGQGSVFACRFPEERVVRSGPEAAQVAR